MVRKHYGGQAIFVSAIVLLTAAPAIAEAVRPTHLAQAPATVRLVRRCHVAIRQQIQDDFAGVQTIQLPVDRGSVKAVMIAPAEKNVRGKGIFLAQGYSLRFTYSCVFNTLGNFVSRASYRLADPPPDRLQGR